jgi:hypothetical protein
VFATGLHHRHVGEAGLDEGADGVDVALDVGTARDLLRHVFGAHEL